MSATKTNATFLITASLLGLLFCSSWAHPPQTFTVGDSKGWTFNVSGWENDKIFVEGHTLVFNYDNSHHSVVAGSKSNYDSCTVDGKKYTSGKDQIKLEKGENYFICGAPGHCALGMKIAPYAY